MYNSIEIEGPQSKVDSISEKLNNGFSLEKFTPIPEDIKSPNLWKKMNWGATKLEDTYINTHKGSPTVEPAIMIGGEADGNLSAWAQKVSEAFPDVTVTLELEEYTGWRKVVFKQGRKKTQQATLF